MLLKFGSRTCGNSARLKQGMKAPIPMRAADALLRRFFSSTSAELLLIPLVVVVNPVTHRLNIVHWRTDTRSLPE